MTDITITPPGETVVTITGPTTVVRTNQPTVPNPRYYGSLISTANQTNPVASQVNLVTFTQLEIGAGVTLTNSTRINIANPGIYVANVLLTLSKTDSGRDDLYCWFRKNGTDIANSLNMIALNGNDAHDIVSLNEMFTMSAAGYIEIAWSSTDTDLKLQALGTLTSPTRPAGPSAHVNVFQVGDV